jgi:hypothetical protein
MVFLKPILGLIQGLIVYWLLKITDLNAADKISYLIALTLPLLGLQIKLPSKDRIAQGLALLIVMGLLYGYAAHHIISIRYLSGGGLSLILAIQCMVSAFIAFVFYCALMEEKRLGVHYATLFCEGWQVILKIICGNLLVFLTVGLFNIGGELFQSLDISWVRQFVRSDQFTFILPSFFFGIAMAILHQYEDVLAKLRNILLAFCHFLYPILVVISLSFLLVIPFSNKSFANFWQAIILLSGFNILLFNGVFQAGLTKSPYARWFSFLIYALFIVTTIYLFYTLKFPILEMRQHGFTMEIFLLFLLPLFLLAYSLFYSLAIFFSKESWLSMVKSTNTILALIIALIYLILALVTQGLTLSYT